MFVCDVSLCMYFDFDYMCESLIWFGCMWCKNEIMCVCVCPVSCSVYVSASMILSVYVYTSISVWVCGYSLWVLIHLCVCVWNVMLNVGICLCVSVMWDWMCVPSMWVQVYMCVSVLWVWNICVNIVSLKVCKVEVFCKKYCVVVLSLSFTIQMGV